MKKAISTLLLLVLLLSTVLVFAACPTQPADPFVGTWTDTSLKIATLVVKSNNTFVFTISIPNITWSGTWEYDEEAEMYLLTLNEGSDTTGWSYDKFRYDPETDTAHRVLPSSSTSFSRK